MITLIIHTFPHELDNYARVLGLLELSDDYKSVQIKSVLNINEKLITKANTIQNEIEKYKKISKKNNIISQVSKKYLGVCDFRRDCISDASVEDLLIFIDCDLYFKKELLSNMIKHSFELKKEYAYFVITPEVVKLWDSSWDVIVNNKFQNKKIGYCNTINIKDIITEDYGVSKLVPINKFKWAGGWFTCISAKLAKYIGIPKKFEGYGHDDTFMMYCCEYMKNKKIKVQQFKIENNVVGEDRSIISKNKSFLKVNNLKQKGTRFINYEYNKFKKRVNEDIYKNNET